MKLLLQLLKRILTKKQTGTVKMSRFQQRLKEVQKERIENAGKPETSSPGGSSTDNLKLHKEKRKEETLSKHWYSVEDVRPPYYTPVDIYTGTYVMRDWSRVSDGEKDYYVNNRDNQVVTKVKFWKKRKGIVYPEYDPMTANDIPKFTVNDIKKLITEIENEYINPSEIEHNLALTRAISHIKVMMKEFGIDE